MKNRIIMLGGIASNIRTRKEAVRMKTGYRMIVAVVGMLMLAAGVAQAATWTNGSGDWNDSNTGNWNPASVPGNSTVISLTQSSGSAINITYAATTLTGTESVTGTRYGNFTIGNAGGGLTTLFIDGTDLLPVNDGTVSSGGQLNITAGTYTPEGNFNLTSGGSVVQSGGKLQTHNYDLFMSGGTYTLNNGTSSVRIANFNPSSGIATFNQSGGYFLPRYTGNAISMAPSGSGQAIYNQTGGTNAMGGINMYYNMSISGNSTYALSGATSFLQAGIFAMNGGTFTQSSGTTWANYQIDVQGGAQMSVSGGTIKMNLLKIGTGGTSGTVTLTGGNCYYAIGSSGGGIQIGGATGSGTMIIKGCTVSGNSAADSSVTIGVTGALRGYGTIANGVFDTISNSGQVIADGDGVDQTLNLSSFNGPSADGSGSVLNPTENTSSNGWFATNHGKLTLPNLPIAAGTSTTNWGEAATDTAIDLVNSATLALTGVASAATLTGSLLALNRTDVTAIPAPAVGMSVHDFSLNKAFTSAILTIRYNHLAVPSVSEGQVRLYWYNGSTWVDKTASLDTVNRKVTSVSLTALGKFAVVYKIRGTVIELY